jgi:hypothetical protein
MHMDDDLRDQAIIGQLARYMRANPLACDTLEGIAQWWLGAEDVAPAQLARALEWMERSGVVTRLPAADGQLRFRRTALNAHVDARLDQLMRDQ